MSYFTNSLLYLVGAPIIAGSLSLLLPDRLKGLTKMLAFLVTSLSLLVSIHVFMGKPLYWPNASDSIFLLDNLSGFITLGISIFSLLVTIYSFGFIDKAFGRYFGYILITLGGSFGAALANNLIALLVFWGLLAVTLYLLVNMKGSDRAASSAKKALIIIGGTDSIMILGVGLVWAMTGTFTMDKIRLPLSGALPLVAYISIAIASFAKAGAMPFHSWIPDVAEDSPVPVTAYLPASLDKLLGIYLLARASLSLFVMNDISNLILLIVGSITIVFAVMMALVQHDFKRLLGYHAVSQVGYMVLGIGTGNPIGIAGGLFHMLNNAIYKSCLFLGSGAVEKRTGTTDLTKLGALAGRMPATFTCFLISSLAISGIPPFNGFVSKWMIYQGIIELGKTGGFLWILWLVSAMFGSVLTLASFMKLLHTVFLGRGTKDFSHVREVPFALLFPMAVLAALCVIFGVFAFAVPLSLFIIPSIGRAVAYSGVWSPTAATLLITIGVMLGFMIYLFSKPGTSRTAAQFIGGEEVEKLERVSGVEFYDTIKEVKGLNVIYRKEEAKSFDIYEQGIKLTSFFTRFLQHLHNGILPTYMVWCVIGMTVMFLILFLR